MQARPRLPAQQPPFLQARYTEVHSHGTPKCEMAPAVEAALEWCNGWELGRRQVTGGGQSRGGRDRRAVESHPVHRRKPWSLNQGWRMAPVWDSGLLSGRVRDQGLCKGPQNREDRGLQHQHQSTRDRIPEVSSAGRTMVRYCTVRRRRARKGVCASPAAVKLPVRQSLPGGTSGKPARMLPIKVAENRGSLKDETIAGKGTLVRNRNRGAKDSRASDCRETSTSLQSGARCVKEASQVESAGLGLAGASTRCYETDGKWKARFTDSAGSSLSAWQRGSAEPGERADVLIGPIRVLGCGAPRRFAAPKCLLLLGSSISSIIHHAGSNSLESSFSLQQKIVGPGAPACTVAFVHTAVITAIPDKSAPFHASRGFGVVSAQICCAVGS